MSQSPDIFAGMSGSKKHLLIIALGAMLMVLSLHSAWSHVSLLRNWFMTEAVESKAEFPTLVDYVNRDARAPFSFRVMVPVLLRTSLKTFGDLKTGRKFPADSTLNITMIVIDWISCSIAALFTYLIVLRTVRNTPYHWYAFLAPVLLIWTINYNYLAVPNRGLFYPYDFPELAFVSVIFWAIMDHRSAVRASLVLLIPLAVLNKETALFFLLVFTVVRLSITGVTRSDVSIAVLAGLLGIGAKLATIEISGMGMEEFDIVNTANKVNTLGAGSMFELQFFQNVLQLRKPISWLAFTTNFGFLWLVLLFLTQWCRDRLSLVIATTMVLWVLIMLTVGVAREFRIYGPMVFPLLWMIGRTLQLGVNEGAGLTIPGKPD